MTVQCLHCKITWRGKPGMYGGRSRVVETRVVVSRTVLRGRRETARTVQRTRECLACRYRWRTREVAVPIKRSTDR